MLQLWKRRPLGEKRTEISNEHHKKSNMSIGSEKESDILEGGNFLRNKNWTSR